MGKNDCLIIIMTHSNYIDVCNTFIDLLKHNWSDCPFKIVAGVIGDNKKVNGIDTEYIGKNKQLTDCIVEISKKYESEYYLCFLGDAFINQKVDNSQVFDLINQLKKEKINYCRIVTRAYDKSKNGELYRYISSNDTYCHSFVAFFATSDFINSEFTNTSDLEFEKKYLKIANDPNQNFIYKDRAMLLKNIFHIEAGIVKGKWDRIVYKKIKKNNPTISLTNRGKISVTEQIKIIILNFLQRIIPVTLRKTLKGILSKLGIKFTTEY